MRITKKWLKVAKQKFTVRMEEAFKLDDERLCALVKSYAPGWEVEGSREELLLQAMRWAIDEAIPDTMTW